MSAEENNIGCPECKKLRRRVAELESLTEKLLREVAALKGQVNKLSVALDEARRAGKRQAAPFRKKEPKAKPKKPGRKSGDEHGLHAHRSPPERIDETCEAPLPAACPYCGGKHIEETAVCQQYQTEIPRKPIHRQFNIHIGHCGDCGKRVQGRHPLQTSDAIGAAEAQLGPDAHAALSMANKRLGLSHGKCADLFKQFFGISIDRSTSARSILRTGRRCEPDYETIRETTRASPMVVPDETGWRVRGKNAWLHAFATENSTYYAIDASRGFEPAKAVLGSDYAGLLIHDGWAPYDRFESAMHQQCLAHLLRRCTEMAEVAVRGAVRFPRAVATLLSKGLLVRDRFLGGELGDRGLAVARGRLGAELERLVFPTKTNRANARLAKFLWKHLDEVFTFLWLPGVDATNWRAEQALRPAVVNRKVWGGNRTWRGAKAQSILMSVLQTCHQQALNTIEYLSRTLCSRQPLPLLAGTR